MEQRIISQFYCFVLVFLFGFCLRALTLGNAKVKCKENLAFQASKCSVSGNAKFKYCKFFAILLQCNYIFRIVLQHNSKLNINFLLHQFSLLQTSLPLTPTLSLCLPLRAKSLFLSSHIFLIQGLHQNWVGFVV